jgi:hypothetical protein
MPSMRPTPEGYPMELGIVGHVIGIVNESAGDGLRLARVKPELDHRPRICSTGVWRIVRMFFPGLFLFRCKTHRDCDEQLMYAPPSDDGKFCAGPKPD